ncbi:MAG TPA: hypothetical protein PKI67_06010, partial [bacterium]|nr:hypothetical protein [bacterium]
MTAEIVSLNVSDADNNPSEATTRISTTPLESLMLVAYSVSEDTVAVVFAELRTDGVNVSVALSTSEKKYESLAMNFLAPKSSANVVSRSVAVLTTGSLRGEMVNSNMVVSPPPSGSY